MAKKISKTDCCRWLNLQGESLPYLKKLWPIYVAKCKHACRHKTDSFGFWLMEHHPLQFKKAYDSFVKHPELLDIVYADIEQEALPVGHKDKAV